MQTYALLNNFRGKNMWDATNITSNNLYFHLKFKKTLKIRLNKKTTKPEKVDSKNQ